MAMASPYKPSLPFNTPSRASPFRRPESPASPSPLRNSTTPTASPSKVVMSTSTSQLSPSKLGQGSSPAPASPTPEPEAWTPRGLVASIPSSRAQSPSATTLTPRDAPSSPTRGANIYNSSPKLSASPSLQSLGTPRPNVTLFPSSSSDNNSLSKLHPAQTRELRECFQILDRDSDGQIIPSDISDMLSQLGLPSDPSSTTRYFPRSSSQTIALPAFLTSISASLAELSPPQELMSAFAAFDESDSGVVDLAELKEALLWTAPETAGPGLSEKELDIITREFSGRRQFGKEARMSAMKGFGSMGASKGGDVFRYGEFVQAIAGGGSGKEERNGEN